MYKKLWIDFETYSEVDIKTAGGMAYAKSDTTVPICMAYAIDDGPVQLWTPNKELPLDILDIVSEDVKVYAHNATFDYRIWNFIMSRDFGWPLLSLDQIVDTQALVASYSLPLSLDKAGMAMDISMPKDTKGKGLIKKLCSPNKKGEQPMPFDTVYRIDFLNFYEYCKRDVEAMREVVNALPRQELIPKEHEVWKLTFNFNSQGVPVAREEVKAIKSYLDKYVTEAMAQVYTLSEGAFNTINQIAKMKDWCEVQGYPMENTQAATITQALEDPNIPGKVAKMLKLRQELGRTSTAKFKKILELCYPGDNNNYWVYDNLVFHGAGPGRWTGRGFQMHNLPRASVPNPEEIVEQFLSGQVINDPVGKGKALVRPMIKAPKGYKLMVSDYHSVENILLAWLAGDTQTLEDFRNGVDQYITMASARYHVPYQEIYEGVKAGDPRYKAIRRMGKVIVLGAGYGMGPETFVTTAKQQFGMDITEEESQEAIKAYRTKYYLIKDLWSELKLAATRAVMTGQRQTYNLITFGTSTVNSVRWLAMRLPSGKCIYYKNPQIEQRYIPKYESMGKVPTITHEGTNPYSKKWGRLALIPGRITENATQGTAREVMAQGMLNVQERMPEVRQIGTVHDESLSLIKNEIATQETLELFNFNLCDIPWAKDAPLSAEGFIADRYRKG